MCRRALRLPGRPGAGRTRSPRRPTSTAPGSPPIDDTTCRSSTPPPTCGSYLGQRPARQAVGLDRRLPDRRHRGQPARWAARSARRSRSRTARSLLIASGALTHTFWPLRAAARRTRPAGVEHIFTPEARRGRPRADRVVRGGRPRPGARHDAGVLPVQARGPVRPLPDDDRRAGRGGLHRARPAVRRLRELGRHRPGAPLVRPAGRRLPAPARDRCRGRRHDRVRRRILLDGAVVEVVRDGDDLVAGDGRAVGVDEAVHLPPVEPTKIIAVHLNYRSRVEEFGTRLPAAPTYFHKPIVRAERPRRRGGPARRTASG